MTAAGNSGSGGMRLTGPWSLDGVERFLEQAIIPIRLAVRNSSGPVALSLWFIPIDGKLWCATHVSARLIAYLRSDARCGFEIAADTPPYRGVRGQGVASLFPARGAEMIERLLERYGIAAESRLARMLRSRADEEIAIGVAPLRMTSWDFTQRMKGATEPGGSNPRGSLEQ